MKTCALFGLAEAVASALLVLLFFALGFHSSAEKLSGVRTVSTLASLAITITATVLGIRARRSKLPPESRFGYGSALGCGLLIALFAALVGTVATYVYFSFINPGLDAMLLQAQITKIEATRLSGDRLDQVEKMARFMTRPPIQASLGFAGTLFSGTLVSLIAAAFLKRPEPA